MCFSSSVPLLGTHSLLSLPFARKFPMLPWGRDGAFKFPLIFSSVSKLGSRPPPHPDPIFFLLLLLLLFLLQWSAKICIWEGLTYFFF